jgi:hypothetical protein
MIADDESCADVPRPTKAAESGALFDHLIGPRKQGRRQVEAKRFCGGQVDDQLKMCRLLNWKVGWFFTLDDAGAVLTGGVVHLDCVGAIRDQGAILGNGRKAINGSAPSAGCALENPLAVTMGEWPRLNNYDCCAIRFHCCQLRLQIIYVVQRS